MDNEIKLIMKFKSFLSTFLLAILFFSLAFYFEGKYLAKKASAVVAPTFVSTFQSIGIYWSPGDGSSSNQSTVQYRASGETTWREGFPLWYDSRDLSPHAIPGYRGSLVHLRAGTSYEVKLTLASGETVTSTVTTWAEVENLPIARIEEIDVDNIASFTIGPEQSGSAGGYVLFIPKSGSSGVLDANRSADYSIDVRAHHVIIRGFTIKDPIKHGIYLNHDKKSYEIHDVIIEENDISGWGRQGYDYNLDSAIYARYDPQPWTRDPADPPVNRIIIQRNKLHHPFADANSWCEDENRNPIPNCDSSNDVHPQGPQAVTFLNAGSNHVIRYNEVYSDDDHYFNDGFSGWYDDSFSGFPNADSDIYGNYISRCWDDGIQSEGGNRNVRIWGNYIDKTISKVAIASTSVGPLYIWRNISNIAQKNPLVTSKGEGVLIKAGGDTKDGTRYADGQTYIFHNTTLQPPGSEKPLGPREGIKGSGGFLSYIMSRNNILHVNSSSGDSIGGSGDTDPSNDFDYDLYNGDVPTGSESHGIDNVPFYVNSNDLDENLKGDFTLNIDSPGYNDGLSIPNFSDSSADSAPDMGAHEANTLPMEFGVNAYLTTPMPSPSPVTSPTPTPGPPQGDINEDGLVDSVDMNLVLDVWGEVAPGNENKDLNSDGWVNSLDAGVVIKDWTGGGQTPLSLERRVSQGTDDAEECLTNNSSYLTSSDLEFVRDDNPEGGSPCASQQVVGIRFQNITIPQGATVTNAYLEFTVDETDTESTNLTFHGENTDSSSPFTTANYNITNRSKTSSYIPWDNVPSWTTVGDTHQTPDLTSIIQEIINRPSWQSGNALTIIVNGIGQRTAEAYEGSASQASLLHIEY